MKTRIGFIGAGGIASRHIGNLLGFDDIRIVAASDPVRDRAEAAAARADAKAYTDYRAMLDHEELDAVYVCTPPFAHGAPELACIARKLPFFVEKPHRGRLGNRGRDCARRGACGSSSPASAITGAIWTSLEAGAGALGRQARPPGYGLLARLHAAAGLVDQGGAVGRADGRADDAHLRPCPCARRRRGGGLRRTGAHRTGGLSRMRRLRGLDGHAALCERRGWLDLLDVPA